MLLEKNIIEFTNMNETKMTHQSELRIWAKNLEFELDLWDWYGDWKCLCGTGTLTESKPPRLSGGLLLICTSTKYKVEVNVNFWVYSFSIFLGEYAVTHVEKEKLYFI